MAQTTPRGSMLDAALTYAARGWRVFPLWPVLADSRCACGRDCGAAGKHPRIRQWPQRAATNSATIVGWWAQWPDAVVAIATGAESGLVVLDIEAPDKHPALGDDAPDGYGTLAALQLDLGMLPATLTASTPTHGEHLYLRHPGGRVKSSVGELGPGIDVKADGGMVVPPPAPGRHWTVTISPAAMPAAWAARLVTNPAVADHDAVAPSTSPTADRAPPGSATAYGQGALASEVRRVREVPEGQRNKTLYRAACRMGQLVAAGDLAVDLAADELAAVGLARGLTPDEVTRAVGGGLAWGQRHPRQDPPQDPPPPDPATDWADDGDDDRPSEAPPGDQAGDDQGGACPKVVILIRQSGRVGPVLVDCQQWKCDKCGRDRAHKVAADAWAASGGELYAAELDAAELDAAELDAARRMARRHKADRVTIRRPGGGGLLVCAVPFAARDYGWSLRPVDQAEVVELIMDGPIHRADWSDSWRPEAPAKVPSADPVIGRVQVGSPRRAAEVIERSSVVKNGRAIVDPTVAAAAIARTADGPRYPRGWQRPRFQ